MQTSPRQPSQSGKEKSMFSQADFPVSPSAMQEAEKERKMTATSGLKCYERFGRYSPLGSLLKTLLASRRWYNPAVSLKWDVQTFSSKKVLYVEKNTGTSSMPSVKTLSEKDMKSNRLLFQLVPQERPIEETGYGLLPTVQTQGLKRCNKKGKTEFVPLDLLPTPNAMDIAHKDMEINERGRRNPKKGKTDHSLGLEDMAVAQLLPTPTALDKGGGRINKSLSPNAAERPTLALAARKGLLPTPCSIEATKFTKTINPNSQMGQGLTALAVNGLLLTPSATDGLRSTMTMDSLKSHNKENANLAEQIAHKVGGGTSQLNPLFVEEMMGFPLMWTALPFLSPSGDKNP